VAGKTYGVSFNEYALWTNSGFVKSCRDATLHGTPADQKEFCEDGVAGIKAKIGKVKAGERVELLDPNECADEEMSSVRVLSGALKGETGCIAPSALSTVKP
jgi:hypothetical protein